MDTNQNIFGNELKKLRKSLELTQVQLASAAKISSAYVSQIETGKKRPTDRVITKISSALDIPENRLLIKIGKMKMDFTGTFTTHKKEVSKILNSLSDEQFQELVTYLNYLKVKTYISG